MTDDRLRALCTDVVESLFSQPGAMRLDVLPDRLADALDPHVYLREPLDQIVRSWIGIADAQQERAQLVEQLQARCKVQLGEIKGYADRVSELEAKLDEANSAWADVWGDLKTTQERLTLADQTIVDLIATRDELERDGAQLAIALRGLVDRIEDNGTYVVGGTSVISRELSVARNALRNEA